MPLAKRLIAEGLGTGFLLAAIVGSGIMAERLTDNVALALLCNSLATGAILTVLILVLGPVSGAHFNPAVTLAFRARRSIGSYAAAGYVASQLIGAILGIWLAHLMFSEAVFQVGSQIRSGPPMWLAEGVATFGLVLTIFGTLAWKPDAVAPAVGLYIVSAYWFTASASFANPAVTIARCLTDTFAGIHPANVPAFVSAQVLGALLAAAICAWLISAALPVPHLDQNN